MSHPVWVRGLKPLATISEAMGHESHPVWVRGLKLYHFLYIGKIISGRTPCGCVD